MCDGIYTEIFESKWQNVKLQMARKSKYSWMFITNQYNLVENFFKVYMLQDQIW